MYPWVVPTILLAVTVLCGIATPFLYKWADKYLNRPARKVLRAFLMTIATITMVAAVVCGTFALKAWIEFFVPNPPPVLRTWSYFGGAVLLAIAAVVYFFRARKYRGATTSALRHTVIRNLIAGILATAMALGLVATAIVGLINPQALNDGGDTGRTDFMVTMDEEALNQFLIDRYGLTGEQIAAMASDGSLPTHRAERNKAVKDAGFLVNKGDDAVSTPMEKYGVLLDEKTSESDLEAAITYSMNEVDWLTLTDSIYAVGRAEQYIKANEEVLRQNAWLRDWMDDLNRGVFVNPDVNHRGFFGMTEKDPETGNYRAVPEHFWNQVRLVVLGGCFSQEKPVVDTVSTTWNLHDSDYVTEASAMRFVENPQQIEADAIVLTHTYWYDEAQTHGDVTQIGYTVGDKRPLIPAEAEKKGGSTNLTNTGPTWYTLTIEHLYENGQEAAPTETEPHKAGDKFTVYAKTNISGYTADRPSESGVMPASNHKVTFVYSKDNTTVSVVFRYWKEYVGGEPAAPTKTYWREPGKSYKFTLPTVANYEPVDGLYERTVYVPQGGTTVDVVYTRIYKVDISFKFADTGAQADVPWIEHHRNGESYSVGPRPGAVPRGYYAYPNPISGVIQGQDVAATMWFVPDGWIPDGNGWKDTRYDPINTSRDGDPTKTNAERGGNTNPLGSGQGDVGRGGELVDGSKTPPYVPPASSGTTVITEPPATQGTTENTEPPAQGTNPDNQSTVTTGQGTNSNPSDAGKNHGIVGAPPD